MVRLSASVPHDAEEWARCNNIDSCPDPKPNEWANDPVDTLVTKKFADEAGPALDYLKNRTWPNDLVNSMLAWMSDNQATGDDGAKHFLKEHKNVWTNWVSSEAAAKIEAVL